MEIGQLASLEVVHQWQPVYDCASVIQHLTSLETLWLYTNKFTSLPTWIGQLTKLAFLTWKVLS